MYLRGRRGTHKGFWFVRPEVNNHFEDVGVDGRVVLRWVSKK